MKRISSILAVFTMLVMVTSLSAGFGSAADADASEKNKHVKSVTAITEVFGDGQRISSAAVECDKNIVNSKRSASTFSVEGRTITRVYANNAAAKASQGIDGRYAIIELSESDKGASIYVQDGPRSTRREVKISVTQAGEITTTDGENYPPDAVATANDKQINLVVDDFLKLEFMDPKTRKILRYNCCRGRHKGLPRYECLSGSHGESRG